VSEPELVYSAEGGGYSLQFGLTVNLPVDGLLETLLKLHQETAGPLTIKPTVTTNLTPSSSSLDLYQSPAREEEGQEYTDAAFDDPFLAVPISPLRVDDRGKWTTGTFFLKGTHNSNQGRQERTSLLASTKLSAEAPVFTPGARPRAVSEGMSTVPVSRPRTFTGWAPPEAGDAVFDEGCKQV
jgi:hypothetical protein